MNISNVWVATTQFFIISSGTSIPFHVTFCRDQLRCPKGCLKKPRGVCFCGSRFFGGGICFGTGKKDRQWGTKIYPNLPSLKLTVRPWKWMVGILLSYWGGPIFRGSVSFRAGKIVKVTFVERGEIWGFPRIIPRLGGSSLVSGQ